MVKQRKLMVNYNDTSVKSEWGIPSLSLSATSFVCVVTFHCVLRETEQGSHHAVTADIENHVSTCNYSSPSIYIPGRHPSKKETIISCQE